MTICGRGTIANVLLTDAQVAQYNELGFVVLEDVFDAPTMEALDQALEAHFRKHEEALRAEGDSGISRAGEIAFTAYIAEEDETVRAFVKRPEFVELSTRLLGTGDTDLYWNQTVYKHPEGDKEFPWHQDDAYTPVRPAPYLTLWLAISDATPENGCISVLPGSHADGLRPHEATSIGLVGYPSDAPDQGIQVPVRSGSMIAFPSLCLHKSGPNRSSSMHKAYVIQYSAHPLFRVSDGEEIHNPIPIARSGKPA